MQKPANIWSPDPLARLHAIHQLDEGKRMALESKAIEQSCLQGKWPFGMPTSVNPWLLMIGISPGAGEDNGKDDRSGSGPVAGGVHHGFGGEHVSPRWKAEIPYWDKVRELSRQTMRSISPGLSEPECLSLSGHLNLGLRNAGTSSNDSVEPKIAAWTTRCVTEILRPRVVVGFGLLGKSEVLKRKGYWQGTALEPVVSNKPDQEISFSAPKSTKTYRFRIWNLDAGLQWPLPFVLWPNHPSRHPFGDYSQFSRSCKAFTAFMQTQLND